MHICECMEGETQTKRERESACGSVWVETQARGRTHSLPRVRFGKGEFCMSSRVDYICSSHTELRERERERYHTYPATQG